MTMVSPNAAKQGGVLSRKSVSQRQSNQSETTALEGSLNKRGTKMTHVVGVDQVLKGKSNMDGDDDDVRHDDADSRAKSAKKRRWLRRRHVNTGQESQPSPLGQQLFSVFRRSPKSGIGAKQNHNQEKRDNTEPHECNSNTTEESGDPMDANQPAKPSSPANLIARTKIIPEVTIPEAVPDRTTIQQSNSCDDGPADPLELARTETPRYSCSTAILQHSYFGEICRPKAIESPEGLLESEYGSAASGGTTALSHHPEDPTVQESIECIFASQLEEGISFWDGDEEDDDDDEDQVYVSEDDEVDLNDLSHDSNNNIVSPSALLQSKMLRPTDEFTKFEPNANLDKRQQHQQQRRMKQSSKTKSGRLVYLGTAGGDNGHVSDGHIIRVPTFGEPSGAELPSCKCENSQLPTVDPSLWPQAPLMLRPTPGSGTVVKGARFSNSAEYFWQPSSGGNTWSDALAHRWNKPRPECGAAAAAADCQCPRCVILPINNGNEESGEAIVIDFESHYFDGSFMLRLRHTEGTTKEPYDDKKGYFEGMNRRYQAVIRGRFKERLPWTKLVTGFCLDRPAGKLPSKWILKGGIKVLSFFAPQLDVQFDSPKPYSLSPLGSTPQSVAVERQPKTQMDGTLEEPTIARDSLMGEVYPAPTSLQRARGRKKAFDKAYVHQKHNFCTDPSKTYTFEFLQHLFNFQDFSMELGSMLGSVQLGPILDGQPFQIMAMHADGEQRIPLWSFDVWHKCLWEAAKRHD